MELVDACSEIYLEYIFSYFPETDVGALTYIEQTIENTNWDSPITSTDWNNLAVIDLINADIEKDLEVKSNLVEYAKQKLKKGFSIDGNLCCAAHYILLQSMIGESNQANTIALDVLVSMRQDDEYINSVESGLIFLPFSLRGDFEVELILTSTNAYLRNLMLLAEVLRRSQFVFYSQFSIRILRLANQVFPESINIPLCLGIAELINNYPEGIVYLKQAHKNKFDNSATLQAIYLNCRDKNLDRAIYWLENAQSINKYSEKSLEWKWQALSVESQFTYVTFEQDLLLAVEPSFRSIVTSVLIAQGDWFEYEMEFWRDNIHPHMTIIDVGANAGVYTFSAAKRVGNTGLVLTIEPFSQCVTYLNETCKINQFDWVKVCAGAASDFNGKAKLALNSASELNEIVVQDNEQQSHFYDFEEVDCFTLDSLIDRYDIIRVDFLKIDAEGHELQVLKGSECLIREFRPTILYENIARSNTSNLPVAEYLVNLGYKLYHYQPYVKKLIPIDINNRFDDHLNIIAKF
jgi:FkbM family methyltransferase